MSNRPKQQRLMRSLSTLAFISLSSIAQADEPTAPPITELIECIQEKIKPGEEDIDFRMNGLMYGFRPTDTGLTVHLPQITGSTICGKKREVENYPYRALHLNPRSGEPIAVIPSVGRVEVITDPDHETVPLAQEIVNRAVLQCKKINEQSTPNSVQEALAETVRFDIQVGIGSSTCSGFIMNTEHGPRIYSAGHCFAADSFISAKLQWIAEQDETGIKKIYQTSDFKSLAHGHDGYLDYEVIEVSDALESYLPQVDPSHNFSGLIGNPHGTAWSYGSINIYERKEVETCEGEKESLILHEGHLDDLAYSGISGGGFYVDGTPQGIIIAGNSSSQISAYPLDRVPDVPSANFETPPSLEICDVKEVPKFVDAFGNIHTSITVGDCTPVQL